MKPVFAVFVSALIAGHTFGHYLPNEYQPSSCGCGSKWADLEYSLGSPQSEEVAQDDTRYKFNFEVEQPKASESQSEPKSYAYDIQAPPSEPKPEDTKYKFDYTIQTPAEDKLAESEPKTFYTKVDRVSQDKPDCGCRQGKPCSCGYSPEQCAVHCNADRSPYNAGYVLPVRYDNGGDYVVYEMPQTGSEEEYVRRNARQASDPADAFKAAHDRIREAIAQITSGSTNGPQLGSALDTSALKDSFDQLAEHPLVQHATKFIEGFKQNGPQLGSTLGAPLDTSAMKDTFDQLADHPLVQHATKFVEGVKQTFAIPARRRRDANVKMPMLRVKEYESARDKSTEDYSKYLAASRVELKPSEKQEWNKNEEWNKKEEENVTQCTSCGSKLTESLCKRCGSYQPQYVEYVEGKPVSYYPGPTQAKSIETSSTEPRYVYDRYGHRYLENNGNLRLIAPQYQEAIVGDQPDFAGLANILNQNQEIISKMNRTPGRLMPQPADFAQGAIDLIHDMSHQTPIGKRDADEKEQKPEQRMTAAWEKNEKPLPRSMYQIIPMKYEGKEGKLAVKVYSSKNDKSKTSEAPTTETKSMNTDERPKPPTVKKFTKNNKQFEILSFDDYKTSSDEEIRRVLDHLHSKQKW